MIKKFTMKLIGKERKKYIDKVFVDGQPTSETNFETIAYFTYSRSKVKGIAAAKLPVDDKCFSYEKLVIGEKYYITVDRHMQLVEIEKISYNK